MQEQSLAADQNLANIKRTISFILPGSRIILFGSRSRGDYDDRSDYDIIAISDNNMDIKAKRRYASLIRRELAVLGIPVDVLVKTKADISLSQDKIGSVVREAMRDGVTL